MRQFLKNCDFPRLKWNFTTENYLRMNLAHTFIRKKFFAPILRLLWDIKKAHWNKIYVYVCICVSVCLRIIHRELRSTWNHWIMSIICFHNSKGKKMYGWLSKFLQNSSTYLKKEYFQCSQIVLLHIGQKIDLNAEIRMIMRYFEWDNRHWYIEYTMSNTQNYLVSADYVLLQQRSSKVFIIIIIIFLTLYISAYNDHSTRKYINYSWFQSKFQWYLQNRFLQICYFLVITTLWYYSSELVSRIQRGIKNIEPKKMSLSLRSVRVNLKISGNKRAWRGKEQLCRHHRLRRDFKVFCLTSLRIYPRLRAALYNSGNINVKGLSEDTQVHRKSFFQYIYANCLTDILLHYSNKTH